MQHRRNRQGSPKTAGTLMPPRLNPMLPPLRAALNEERAKSMHQQHRATSPATRLTRLTALVLAVTLAGCTTFSPFSRFKRPAPPQDAARAADGKGQPGVSAAVPAAPAASTSASTFPTERIAVAPATRQPDVTIGGEEQTASQAERVMKESVGTGVIAGSVPLLVCGVILLCTPVALAATVAVLAAGTVIGTVIGVTRALTHSLGDKSAQTEALLPQEIEASRTVITAAAENAISTSALHACVLRQLMPADGATAHPNWLHGGRTASFIPIAPARIDRGSFPGTRATLAQEGYRYLLETFVSKVALVHDGVPQAKVEDAAAHFVVEAGFRLVDLNDGVSREQTFEWRSGAYALREWRNEVGALAARSLADGCRTLAEWIGRDAALSWQRKYVSDP